MSDAHDAGEGKLRKGKVLRELSCLQGSAEGMGVAVAPISMCRDKDHKERNAIGCARHVIEVRRGASRWTVKLLVLLCDRGSAWEPRGCDQRQPKHAPLAWTPCH